MTLQILRLWLSKHRPALIVLPPALTERDAKRLKAHIDLCVVPTRAEIEFLENGG